MREQGHTPGPRARVRVHLVNPESGYESETETTVSAAQWAVIDAVLCGREQPFAAATELLDALVSVTGAIGDWARPTGANGMIPAGEDHPLCVAANEARRIIAKATAPTTEAGRGGE